MAAITGDPRPARSRARLLEAATTLLRTGGPSAVTIDAVTKTANVARATLYRHFSSANDLLAAAFTNLLQPAPMPPVEGSLRDRLLAVVVGWAETIAEAPTLLTAMTWLASGPDAGATADVRRGDSDAVGTLRQRIIQFYSVPFDAILDSPSARAELREVDRIEAIALLIGPIILGKLSTLADFDYRRCAEAAVDGFLAVYGSRSANPSTAPAADQRTE
ncbi:bacterial regulatory s, tetR family protein [Mycolicibacterium hassiacum DSM 44199]|jgi:AcrR family transcriptional regulator|uniref:Bacterial regulatory s, tetR family protein n=1 Tax=Mycolicibacterium hassiacum (strain DSM 44199 / CIP 105218 / JCM 12690 / 3849) TaxID=1122247 RepID=K5BGL9_MYCHD|nr:TetR/AcrR family transcriptional regulator [Mycolicibacterium hassiacum]EKF24892.1 bacterial regulatory s, tetR family protein [Mycolicibacterium hassiacum DSM 44199]MBX5485903.1 TetR/AcrR family transcriptional regulator [Mycolicibacterium hassiacum]MDA4088199.1 TetR family transcriptional regulator [Mycolicibacterium hassiacum DSM 44199]VCT88544.1 putative HTH-type transcriptional regulator [Mycolicibacterium hassiacum DSM 44199]